MKEEIFNDIWERGLIVLDTCTLDFIERCEVNSAKKIMDILLICKDHVFVPSHVKNVEMKNYFDLEKKKKSLRIMLDELKESIKSILSSTNISDKDKQKKVKSKTQKLINQMSKYDFHILSKKLHQVQKLDNEQILFYLDSEECNTLITEYDEFLDSNTVRSFYSMIMKNVFSSFSEEEMEIIEAEGIERRRDKIPPACGDDKKSINSFGDLIIWKEILRNVSKEKHIKILFITEDKKKGNNWYDEGGANIHTLLKDEVQRKYGYDAVSICDLKDFIINCKNYVSEDIEDLISYIKKNSIKVIEVVEDYLKNAGYEFLAEKTWEAVSEHCDVDHSLPDTSLDITIMEFNYNIEEHVEAEITFSIEFETENFIRWGGDDWSDSSNVYAELTTEIIIDIIEGYYRDDVYTLDLKNMSLDIIDINTQASAPFGMDDCDDYEQDYDDYI